MARNVINTLGATNLSKKERSALDYYGTDPKAVEALLDKESFSKHNPIWEPSSGHGNILNVLKDRGYKTYSTDIYDYGCQDEIINFLEADKSWSGNIIMNPPYCFAEEFVTKAIDLVCNGSKIAAFLRLPFLEGQGRYERLYKHNKPKVVYVFSKRQVCSKVDDFTESSAIAYCWMVWEKGYEGETILKWI